MIHLLCLIDPIFIPKQSKLIPQGLLEETGLTLVLHLLLLCF